jgi:hypothetical protein
MESYLNNNMSTKLFASQMRAVIEEIKLKGTPAISCDNLIAYLNEIETSHEDDPSPVVMEKYKADLSNWISANNHAHESRLEMFRSVITAGQSSLKSSFLLNGGAALALLAFIGHLTEINSPHVHQFICSLILFSFGVLTTSVTSGLTYLCQWLGASANLKAIKAANYVNIVAIIVGACAYGFFYGVFMWPTMLLERFELKWIN